MTIIPFLSVKDVDAAITFYTEKLGFTKDMAMDGPDGKTTFGFVRLGDSSIGLNRAETENAGQGVVFMISIPDDANIDEVYQSVQAKGVTIEEPIKTEYWGDRVFSVKDLDGFYISLYETVAEMDIEHVAKVISGEVERE